MSRLLEQMQGLFPYDKINKDVFGGAITPEAIGVLKSIISSLSSNVREGNAGSGTPVSARVGRFAGDWNRNNDALVAKSLTAASRKSWFDQRDALQRAMHPQWHPDKIEGMIDQTNPHYERFIANMLMYDNTKALKSATSWLSRKGLGRSEPDSRENQAYSAVANELYNMSSDLGPHSQWQSLGGPDKSMQAMLQLVDSGVLHKLSTQSGMFDRKGGMTDMGRDELHRMMGSAGSGLRALQSMSGTDMDAMKLMRTMAAPDKLGIDFFHQLSDPTMAARLHSYHRMSQRAGLNPDTSINLLMRSRKFFGTRDIRPALNYSEQMLAMTHGAHAFNRPAAGDDANRQKLMVMTVDRARRSQMMWIASGGAATLAKSMGRGAAWNYVDNALKRSHNSRQLLYMINTQLSPEDKITRKNFQNTLADPEAYEYFASGRPVSLSIQHTVRPFANYLKRNSPFLARHADRIMRERGQVDMATVASWMKDTGASSAQIGGVMRHLRQIGPHMARKLKFPGALGTDDVLGFVSNASHIGARREFIDAARESGEQASDWASTHARKGRQAFNAAMLAKKSPLASAVEAVAGSDRHLTVGAENRIQPTGSTMPQPGWKAGASKRKPAPTPETAGTGASRLPEVKPT